MTGARRAEWRENWPVVAGAAVGMGTAFPLYAYVSSLFVPELTAAFGWTRGEMASAMAAGVFGSLAAPLAGRLADRFGIRPVIAVSTLALGLVYGLLALQPGTLAAFALLSVVLAAAGAGCAATTYTRAIAARFSAARGLALGVTITGVAAVAAIAPPLIAAAIGYGGWQAGYLLLAFLAVGVGLPLAMALVREPRRQTASSPATAMPWGRYLRDGRFWLLILAFILVNVPGAGIISQLVPLLTDTGLAATTAALMLSVYAGAVIVGRLATGWLVDRGRPLVVAAFFSALPALGCLMLLALPLAQAEILRSIALLAVALIGLQQGSEMDLVGFLVARFFGIAHYSSLVGILIVALTVSAAVGVAFFGRSHDATGSYDLALTLSAPLFLLASVAFLAIGLVRSKTPHSVQAA